mmetsp:Transcript_23269/g.58851  ORF Transcript_23269/g.58851 Transcript_23269/m.58851 type:complete len:238 (-) Transcript_23269:930-1643(-)
MLEARPPPAARTRSQSPFVPARQAASMPRTRSTRRKPRLPACSSAKRNASPTSTSSSGKSRSFARIHVAARAEPCSWKRAAAGEVGFRPCAMRCPWGWRSGSAPPSFIVSRTRTSCRNGRAGRQAGALRGRAAGAPGSAAPTARAAEAHRSEIRRARRHSTGCQRSLSRHRSGAREKAVREKALRRNSSHGSKTIWRSRVTRKNHSRRTTYRYAYQRFTPISLNRGSQHKRPTSCTG